MPAGSVGVGDRHPQEPGDFPVRVRHGGVKMGCGRQSCAAGGLQVRLVVVYTTSMTPEVLASELNREPFLPIRVHLSDGRALDILNPGLCFIARLAVYVFAAKPPDALAEDVQVVSLRHIVSVETVSPAQRS